jgi:ribonuclease P protein component
MERCAAEQAVGKASVPRRPDMRLPRERRLTDSPHFKEAFDQGRKIAGACMVLWLRTGEGAALRLGSVASRKSFRRSVDRSRARRYLRETFRRIRYRLQGQVDIVLLARPALLASCAEGREKELLALVKRAGILKPEVKSGETACAGS